MHIISCLVLFFFNEKHTFHFSLDTDLFKINDFIIITTLTKFDPDILVFYGKV